MLLHRDATQGVPLVISIRGISGGPYKEDGSAGGAVGPSEWRFGGMGTHPANRRRYMDAAEKTLNKYLYKDLEGHEDFNRSEGSRIPAEQRRPRELFRCPEDDVTRGPFGRDFAQTDQAYGTDGLPGATSPYFAYGTSYFTQYSFIYDRKINRIYMAEVMGGAWPITYSELERLNRAISRQVSKWRASRTLVLAEMQFARTFIYDERFTGFHGQFSTHNALFLDGRAEPITVRARDLQNPPGWQPGSSHPHRGDGWSTYDDQ